MEKDIIEFTLPPAPRGLCFDRNDFVKTNFSVDKFLAEHQDVASLETMRDDLGVYLKVLRLAMIELINKDYVNFVNLCATLIGFDKTIVKIQAPLGQLHEEVEDVKKCIEDAMHELSLWLNKRHALIKKKQLLKFYSQTINCLNSLDNILQDITDKTRQEQIILADRAAMEYNQLKFSIGKCDSVTKPQHKKQYNEVGGRLVQILNDLIFQFWNDRNEDNLLKTLMILTSLDRITETEMLIRKKAVAPLLQEIISEPSLQRSKEGLNGIFERIFSLLDTKLMLLLKVTQHSKLTFQMQKFRFLVNCFWCEIEHRLEVNLASIFAPGNPQLFYRRYMESMQFIKKLETYCHCNETVKLLHSTAEYKSFQRRWNLPVYFQIRFQEIAGSFEASLNLNPVQQNKGEFVLEETSKCWKALQNCWSEGIFIEALSHKFWKLSLQLLSRYCSWIKSYCTQRPRDADVTVTVNRSLITDCLNIYVDTLTLLQKLPSFIQNVESKVSNQKVKMLIKQSILTSEMLIHENKAIIKECMVKELFDYLNMQLKQVSDIPRLYRKTNRSVPTKPCSYIDIIIKTVKDFREDSERRLDNAFLVEIFESLFKTMTESYFKCVEDVLTSVQKTEESLRRLKQIRELSSQQNSETAGITDGDKIRLQLNVDVVCYSKLAHSLNINLNNVHKLSELTSMTLEAVKNIENK
ncbi:conserved oligomeric Golgi complex subunit 2 [Pieris brassicae]|uniref:conserved oligomeric Golgi complex subunit 2 n=1 Tax=Pieris brassicae TaxID=7116 RepID=UPI001E65F5DC|nr:conserved oligomeric Golgi complex subunit 2 [Pieris brassicae]